MVKRSDLARSEQLWAVDCEWDEHRFKAGAVLKRGRLQRVETLTTLEGEEVKVTIPLSHVNRPGKSTIAFPDEPVELWIAQHVA